MGKTVLGALKAFAFGFLAMLSAPASNAAEIKLLAAGALRQVLGELIPQFEKEAGHHVSVTYGPVGALTDRLAKGETADVAVVSDMQIGELQTLRKISPRLELEPLFAKIAQSRISVPSMLSNGHCWRPKRLLIPIRLPAVLQAFI
jgi:accessory colonization factor AcfC